MSSDIVQPDLQQLLRRLKLSRILDTLSERLSLARQQQMTHQEFLIMLFGDEVSRREAAAVILRSQRAHLDPNMRFENSDPSTGVFYDKLLFNELCSLRFIEAHQHVAIVGPVGVGKTFVAHALGHAACRRGYAVYAVRADRMLKNLRHSRLDNSHETELRKLLSVDLLIIDDFGLDAMDASESRDAYEIMTERHRAGSIIVTSNRAPDEWLSTFADPVRAQSAIDRFTSNAFDLTIEGESYRARQKPTLKTGPEPQT